MGTCTFTYPSNGVYKELNYNCFYPLRNINKGHAYISVPKENRGNFSFEDIEEAFERLKSEVFNIELFRKGKFYSWEAKIDLSMNNLKKVSTLMFLRYFWEGSKSEYGNIDCFETIPKMFLDIVRTTDIEPFEALQLAHYSLKGSINTNHTLLNYSGSDYHNYFYKIKTKNQILSSFETEDLVNSIWSGLSFPKNDKLFLKLKNKEYKEALEMLK